MADGQDFAAGGNDRVATRDAIEAFCARRDVLQSAPCSLVKVEHHATVVVERLAAVLEEELKGVRADGSLLHPGPRVPGEGGFHSKLFAHQPKHGHERKWRKRDGEIQWNMERHGATA
jgi:hypothetical protein